MSFLSAVVLGIVQGFTEFLPVSSSGHLVLGQVLLGVKDPGLSFAVWAHLGTTAATVVFLWSEITWLLRGLVSRSPVPSRAGTGTRSSPRWTADARLRAPFEAAGRTGGKRAGWRYAARACKDPWRVAGLVLLGSLPAALVGLTLKDHIERAFSSPVPASLGLLFTGFVLFFYGLREGRRALEGQAAEPFATVNWGRALLAGVAQAVAILPGISRSGMTIVAGACSGMDREDAARFSFFLALVAVTGAALLDARSAMAAGMPILTAVNLVGAAAAFFSGLVALGLVFRTVRKGSFSAFAYYCWAVGLVGLFISLHR
ncbi:MAG: undecaprenyl-diphosphate phosphatase [Firmicutes bacterium]|nr:undecaprenyl-diphosphate phosphatase [Candidatus Fermentithermobacillaceae bacterium]